MLKFLIPYSTMKWVKDSLIKQRNEDVSIPEFKKRLKASKPHLTKDDINRMINAKNRPCVYDLVVSTKSISETNNLGSYDIEFELIDHYEYNVRTKMNYSISRYCCIVINYQMVKRGYSVNYIDRISNQGLDFRLDSNVVLDVPVPNFDEYEYTYDGVPYGILKGEVVNVSRGALGNIVYHIKSKLSNGNNVIVLAYFSDDQFNKYLAKKDVCLYVNEVSKDDKGYSCVIRRDV
ncbi:hypothetical protein D3C81_09780 [compost metagenome]